MVIPTFGISNPSLSQSNSISSYAQASSSSTLAQTVNQAVTNSSDVVSFDLQASQDGSVIQSGAASSAQAQANRTNLAGWGGLVALPQPQQFAAPPGSVQTLQSQTVVLSSIQSPTALMTPFVFPPAMQPALPQIVPTLHLLPPGGPLVTPGDAFYGSSEFGLRSQTGATEAAAASGPDSTPSGPAPVCEHCTLVDLLGGAVSSARGDGSDGAAVALTPFYLFAPPGAGRVQLEQPAPGDPADVSPFERPG